MLSFRSDRWVRVAALALVAACGGCSDILARRDTIAYSAGNSIAANRAIQTIDPYPRRSFVRGQQTDGTKAQQAVRRYLTPDTTPVGVAPTLAPPAPATAQGQTQ